MFDYLWTTGLGIIPSSFPIVTGAALAGTILVEQKEVDPVTLGINVLSLLAGVYVMIRLGAIAMGVIKGIQQDRAAAEAAPPPPPKPPLQKAFDSLGNIIQRTGSYPVRLVTRALPRMATGRWSDAYAEVTMI